MDKLKNNTKIKKFGNKVKKHPIIASIIFFLVLSLIPFILGYKQDLKKIDKDGKKYSFFHHFLNGMKWLGIIFAIFLIVVLTLAFMFSADFLTLFLFGGDVISIILKTIASLITSLSN